MSILIKDFFFRNTKHSSSGRSFFLALSDAGHAGARLYTTVQVWVPAGLRGACAGRSKSRNLAGNHGVAFRGAIREPSKTMENPRFSFFALFLHSTAVLQFVFAPLRSLQAFPLITAMDTLLVRVWTHCLCVCVLRVRAACVCGSQVYVCVLALGRAPFGTVFLCWYTLAHKWKHRLSYSCVYLSGAYISVH